MANLVYDQQRIWDEVERAMNRVRRNDELHQRIIHKWSEVLDSGFSVEGDDIVTLVLAIEYLIGRGRRT